MWTTNIKAISEVNKILNQMAPSSLAKVPQKLLDELEKNATANVDYIKPDIPLEDLNLEEETKEILAVISYNYFCNNEEKKNWDKELLENEKIYQENIKLKYNPDKLFEKNIQKISKDTNTKETSLTEYKKETFFTKILNFIKKFFKKK